MNLLVVHERKNKGRFSTRISGLVDAIAADLLCKHDLVLPDGGSPEDTTGAGNPVDTLTSMQICNPDSVYFDNQILPILVSNCALSGCQEARTAEDGVILTNYEQAIRTAGIWAGQPGVV